MLLLFAPGAGAPSSSNWMQAWQSRLETLGSMRTFDYPYQLAGKRAPDRHAVLVSAHRTAFESARAEHAGPVVLAGKSMGGRIGCHVAVESAIKPQALVCFGYPLISQSGAERDAVLLSLTTPILFLQGTRDALCPLERLHDVRERMHAPNELFVVQGGDHSLLVSGALLRKQALTQATVDAQILVAIGGFLSRWAASGPRARAPDQA